MASAPTPDEIADRIVGTLTKYIETRTTKLTKEQLRAVMKIVAARMAVYFLMRRI